MLDEDGNPDIDEGEIINAEDEGEEGWDVSDSGGNLKHHYS